jgi:DamX protein
VEDAKTDEYSSEEWLLQRNPDHYTIQIIALLDPVKLHTFIDNHPELQPFALYQQQWKGKPLWVLVQGDYADIQQARAAVDGFPTDLQKRDKLWIRRFVMIQGLLF